MTYIIFSDFLMKILIFVIFVALVWFYSFVGDYDIIKMFNYGSVKDRCWYYVS